MAVSVAGNHVLLFANRRKQGKANRKANRKTSKNCLKTTI